MSDVKVANITFDILDDIGAEGANSDVFKILDTGLNSEMVLKQICKTKIEDPEKYFDEARIVYSNKHPNVVGVNYTCQDDDFVYITMPYYKNGSLSKLMEDRFLTLREIIRYSVQFLSGLHNIHSNNLLHFDLKPDNILLSDRNEAMLSDFGLAKYMDEYGFTQPDQFYMKHVPPEATSTQIFSTPFDIYQAGLTMYRMCVGSLCFNLQYESFFNEGNLDRDRFKVALENGTFPERNKIPVHIHSKVKAAILKCLQPDPDDRFDSALDIINSISDIDENYLDWKYELDGTIQKWSKQASSGVLHSIELDENRSSTAYKIGTTDRRSSILDYTKKGLTNAELKRFIKQQI